MLVSSRIATLMRGAVPFATYTAAAIQLGFIGYNLWEKYIAYRRLVEADSRAGITRSLNEAIELVVKPRRKRRNVNETNENQLEIVEGCSSNQENIPCNSGISSSSVGNVVTNSSDKENSNSQLNTSNDSDVQIVYDSSLMQHIRDNSYHSEEHDEVFSTVSTSIESTDSNKGIVNDICNECFICASTLNDSRRPVATLPFCYHSFHKKCLDGVLNFISTCPICSTHIFSPV